MFNIFKMALRNLMRYSRRTMLTVSLIVIGVVFVSVFVSVSGSFKNMMISQITDSMTGHVQVHRRGYMGAAETLPQNMNIKLMGLDRFDNAMKDVEGVEAVSERIKFGGMFSTFTETSNIRLNGIDPVQEYKVVPLLPSRILEGSKELKTGSIIIPRLFANSMKVKVGDTVVVVATNRDGSVNGKQLKVTGIIESATGPGGRDGYVHIEDAKEILRMDIPEISEIAIRLKDFDKLHEFEAALTKRLSTELNKKGLPIFDVHTWERLSPFYNIARMIDLMTLFVKVLLVAVVLISILNVMIMAVYERIREIGTAAAIGTRPHKIMLLFLIEGLLMGIIGAATGALVSIAAVFIINAQKFTFSFGQQKEILLTASVDYRQLLAICLTVAAVAVVASLQPAIKASRTEPVNALRHV
ncbi:ABC transporter permease [Seleniivibrio woodruffii]|uniref:Putative ABC transport system permease protein n=1 Tax=Seleniivibrio woodruffii TaxID=1078050 RepID=A0A4R1K787_9BACT|nr:ABC transporter permease [Seleniivibrio woodruffii]TCK59890.1 putative ABC transport system permease protein [Seleniivibrio woodruffii]TVZ35889.1 putative ABC transport system permease protein [Seleniivibrio woodruffii]